MYLLTVNDFPIPEFGDKRRGKRLVAFGLKKVWLGYQRLRDATNIYVILNPSPQ